MKNNILSLEKKFLSYLFNDKKYIAESLGKIKKEHLPETHKVYSMIINYYNKYKNVISDDIINLYFSKYKLDITTITKYKTLISEIKVLKVQNESEFNAIMDELCTYNKRQELLNMAEIIVANNPNDCSDDTLSKVETELKTKLMKITAEDSSVRKEGSLKDNADDRFAEYKNRKEHPELIKCIPTGFKHIDDVEGGFRPGELVYVIGRKGDGKSTLLLNLAHNMWYRGENVILFSLEISKEDYERRFDARAAGVSSNGLKRGKLSDQEEVLYEKYINNVKEGLTPDGHKSGTFYTVDVPKNCTPAYVESKIESAEQKLGIKFGVVIVDYSGIMKPNVPTDVKRFEQGSIALDLKGIARSRECVVLSAAQMNRKGKEDANGKDGKVDTEHVAESDLIADHLDWGIAIRSKSDTTGKIESFKTRDAAPFSFHFNKKYDCMLIMELEDNLDKWDSIGA